MCAYGSVDSWLMHLLLRGNIFVNILWLHTVMILILFFKISSKYRTLPRHADTSVYTSILRDP